MLLRWNVAIPFSAIKSMHLMTSIDHFDLRSFDLNLLIAFDALMEERTVTRAAARLKIGQPAMSHALSTLRMLLRDELFVRVGQVMQPTAKALALAPRIRRALEQMHDVLHADENFDPATQTRTFRIGFSSEMEILLLPGLASMLRQEAPGIKLLGRPTRAEEVHQLLDDGGLDLAVGCFDYSAQRHFGQPLFEQTLACCYNKDIMPLTAPIDIETYLKTEHIVVTLNNTLQGCLDEALKAVGARLNVVVAGAEFLTVLATASCAPLLATVPARMAARHAPRFGLTLSPVPLPLKIPPVSIVWSARSDRDLGTQWLRDRIVSVISRAGEELARLDVAPLLTELGS